MPQSYRIPDPFVVCVHRRGDVRYCPISQYIAKCRELIQAGKFDEIEGLASAHEFGQQAREAISQARKLLPWKKPTATEAAAATNENPNIRECPNCNREPDSTLVGDTPAIGLHNYTRFDMGFRVECEGCMHKGPFRKAGPDAIMAWNALPPTIEFRKEAQS